MDLEQISHFLVLFNRSRSKQHLPFYKQATNVYCSETGGRFRRGVFPLKRVNSRRVEKKWISFWTTGHNPAEKRAWLFEALIVWPQKLTFLWSFQLKSSGVGGLLNWSLAFIDEIDVCCIKKGSWWSMSWPAKGLVRTWLYNMMV